MAAATFAFLAGRRCRASKSAADDTPVPSPTAPVERTGPEKFFHWFRWPVRKKDQQKKIQEENPPEAPQPTTDTSCKKSRGSCLACLCGERPADKADEEKSEKKEEDPKGLTGVVLKVLAAIATGIGVVGAVTVVGGAIFWARFDAIGLPATQAVSVIPKAELLVQGAQEVTLFLLIALGAVLLIALADPKGLISRGTLIVFGGLIGGALFYTMTTNLDWYWVTALTVLTLILAFVCVGIAFTTEQRLLPLLVSVFLASLIFSASCALLIVETQKYAQAIAIRFGVDKQGKGKGLTGIYVTATDKTIYFARSGADPELKGIDTTGLYEVPRADTTTYVVGPLEPTEDAEGVDRVEASAKRLLRRLYRDGKNFVAPPEKPDAETEATKAAAASP